jgi:hypothetical protein
MILDGISYLVYGKVAYVVGFDTEEEVTLNVSISTLQFLQEKGVEKLSYDSGEQYILIEEVLNRYSGGAF